MMRSIVITAALMAAISSTVPAQVPSWAWGVQGGDRGSDEGRRAAADSSGNIYIAGTFVDSALFAPRKIHAFGGRDAVIARLSADGAWQWAYPVGGTEFDAVHDVETDPDGNIYLLATVIGDSARLAGLGGTTVLAPRGESDVVLAKYDPDGRLLWARLGGGIGADLGAGLAVAPDGGIHVIGSFSGTMNFGGASVTSAGGSDLFAAFFAPDGALRRLKRGGGSGEDSGAGIGVDAAGNSSIVGEFTGSAEFGGITLNGTSAKNLVIARFAPDGTALWGIAEGGAQYQGYQPHIAVSGNGSIHLTGTFRGQMTIGGANLASTGESDGYLMSYGADGVPQWGKMFPGTMIQSPSDITTDRNGAVYVTGGSQNLARGSLFVMAFDAAGTQLWLQSDDGASILHNAREGGIAVDHLGNIYMTGGFGGQINFDGARLTSVGSTPSSISGSDLFVARLGSVASVQGDDASRGAELRVIVSAAGESRAEFSLRSAGAVRLALHDMRGALARVLLEKSLESGSHALSLPPDLPQGGYFLVLHGDGWSTSHPIAITR